MGTVVHAAMIVTSWKDEAIEAAACRARNLGLTVLGPSAEMINGYRSILVVSSGSKEGWEDQIEHDARLSALRDWIGTQAYGDGSNNLEFAQVEYGNECDEPTIRTAQQESKQ